jgi:hypothetical protein
MKILQINVKFQTRSAKSSQNFFSGLRCEFDHSRGLKTRSILYELSINPNFTISQIGWVVQHPRLWH